MDASRIIAPSLLSADFSNIERDVKLIEQAGAPWIHLDVMDGHFVPPITFGAQMVSTIRNLTSLVLDVHLMVSNPQQHIKDMIDAGADRLTFHLEVVNHPHRMLKEIQSAGIKAGVAIVPSTPVPLLSELMENMDHVLVMTVNPGWGGQTLIPRTLDKVQQLASWNKQTPSDLLLQIDGGFNSETAKTVWNSGANAAVMGSAFFSAESPASIIKTSLHAL